MIISIVMLVAAAVITAINIGILIAARKRRKAVEFLHTMYMQQHELKAYQKSLMCDSYCKYRESAHSQEELEWECANCPLGEL